VNVHARRWTGVVMAALSIGALVPGSVAVATPPDSSGLSFVAPSSVVTIERGEGDFVALDLGTEIVAGRSPFEVRARRDSYDEPIVATRTVRGRFGERQVRLPEGLLTDLAGFPGFTHLRLTDRVGTTVVDRDQTWCPNGDGEGTRSRAWAPRTSSYPTRCALGAPFALGAVWGIQAGWAVPATSTEWSTSNSVFIDDGTYTAVVSVNPMYQELFGIPARQASATIQVTIRTVTGESSTRDTTGHTSHPGPSSRPAPSARIPYGPRPDLRPLPAFEIGTFRQPGQPGGEDRDIIFFAATVWVAGNSPLVVDGFRRPGTDLMDAYQNFYDERGRQVGSAPVGTMKWDDRDGHSHWHFTDFAQYRLLAADKEIAVRSGKEAFCLANTDPIDYTLPHANWQPENTDLHSSCGDFESQSIRQALDVGNGDTYFQFLPGQSFDITDLPNGTYYIEIKANPDRRLYEQDTSNNVSLRKIILTGEPGARFVDVPPVGLVAG
jgi:hypothetical protein